MKDRIRKVREDNSLTQQKFADLLKLSRNYISQLENGTKESPSERTISDICRLFNVNIEWLLNGTGEPYRDESADFGEICAKIKANDPKAKNAILKYYELTPEDKELFWKFVDRFIKK